MWYGELWSFLEHKIFSLPSCEANRLGLFNPYRDVDPDFDVPEANLIRRANLASFLASLPEPPRVLLVGEAPGWRGCRFSGVPFTSETQLVSGVLPFTGLQSSSSPLTKTEISARFFWLEMRQHHPGFFIWNALPLHPHKSGECCSNRPPTIQESRRFLPLLDELHSILKPARVVSIGRLARGALSQIGIQSLAVRHPSHGGATKFRNSIHQIFEEM
jgi:uracil-DNA glycosylase